MFTVGFGGVSAREPVEFGVRCASRGGERKSPSLGKVGAADQKSDAWLRPWKGPPAEALWQKLVEGSAAVPQPNGVI